MGGQFRCISMAEESVAYKSGKLSKLTSNRTWLGFRSWKDRWVVLRQDGVSYYPTAAAAGAGEAIKGCLPIALVKYAGINPSMKKWGFSVVADENDPQMCYEFD